MALRGPAPLRVPRAPVRLPLPVVAGVPVGETRVLVHGLFGCLFFGALTAKVLVVRTPKMPKLALPVLGGVVFTALTVLWLTSAFWFFTTVEFPGI